MRYLRSSSRRSLPAPVLFLNSSGAVVPCSAGGVPTPSTAWRKADGGPVLTDLPGLRQLRSDGSLVFPPFGADQYRPDVHATSYRCEASNSYGSIGSRDVRVSAVWIALLPSLPLASTTSRPPAVSSQNPEGRSTNGIPRGQPPGSRGTLHAKAGSRDCRTSPTVLPFCTIDVPTRREDRNNCAYTPL
ncbi:hypothetical protein HPB47_007921 [Ixodes persulcatus]|uniref:Uncharacterized protein n=1 Tax=Ixodes persulcatus TaxID=34615 RepID=A0AC60P668_IXOPE|nr:hypothetical protein HPB47_007921 [Ixodes persulcatus]